MGRLESVLAVAVLLFGVAAPAASASCLDYADYPDSTPFLSSTPTTSARQLSVRDGVACVADYTAGLRVLDVSDPTAPQLVVTVPTGSQCLGLDWVGDRLYLACGYSGLVIVDMADRWAPVVLGAVAPWGFEAAVRVAGDFAYLANAYGQFDVVDVSDPSAPVAVASLAVGWDEAKDVELFGDYALVPSGENGLRVIDVSSPRRPRLRRPSPPRVGPCRWRWTNRWPTCATRITGSGSSISAIRCIPSPWGTRPSRPDSTAWTSRWAAASPTRPSARRPS